MSVVELKFYAWNAPNGSLLGTLTDTDLESFEIRPEYRGAESGVFSIARSNPLATTAVLGFGHTSLAGPRLVKVHFPWMPAPYNTDPAFAFWLWEGDFNLLNQDGDDILTFSGPGVRGILSDYVLYHSSTVSDQPARGSADRDGLWWWINEPYGAIATRIFEEGRHAPYPDPATANSTFQFLPDIDFDRTTDSDGQTWSNIAEEYQFPIGTDAGTVLADLEEAGDFTLIGRPDLSFSAYETYGDDLTGTAYGAGVVRVQGDTGTTADNILSDLSRHATLNAQRTHLLGRDSEGSYFTRTHPSYTSGPERWGSLDFPETNDDTLLQKKADQAFVEQGRDQNVIQVELKPGNNPSNGRYLPFVHYKAGDTITVDTGAGEHDYTNEDALLTAFRVALAEASVDTTADDSARSLHVVLELNTARSNAGLPAATSGGPGCRCLELCRTPQYVLPTFISGDGGLGLGEITATVPTGVTDGALYCFVTSRNDGADVTGVTWDPATANEAFTKVGEADGFSLTRLEIWRLLDPTPATDSKIVISPAAGGYGIGFKLFGGVNQSNPDDNFVSATDQTSSSSLTITTPAGAIPIDSVTTWDNDVLLTDGPTPSGTEVWSAFDYTSNPATRDIQFGGSYGDSTPSWTLAATQTWLAVGLAVNGQVFGGDTGPMAIGGNTEEDHGTSLRATRCDHVHPHSDLSDHSTETHHHASSIEFTPTGTIAATDVQAAIAEVASEASGAPTTANYLVGTAQAGLSAEIVVGTTPGGELGGSWGSPTIDATHAGSNHNQPVRKNSAGTVFERRRLNLIEGTNVTLTVADDAGDDEVDITIAATSGVTALDDLSDVTITSPTTAQRLRYNGSAWVNSSLKWSPTTTFDGTNWVLVTDGSGNPVLTEV